MIFAETTESTTRYAEAYSFIGPNRYAERMDLLDAGDGLQRLRRITRPLFKSLVDAILADQPIDKSTDAARALHTVLGGYKTGIVEYYRDLGTKIYESDVDALAIVGADGLGRRVTIDGLEIDSQPITAEILEGLEPHVSLGVTHMAKQYNFPSADQGRHLEYTPIAHISLGSMLDGTYTALQTLLTPAEQLI